MMQQQKPGEPYLQKPEQMDAEGEERLFCWFDMARVCGGDCVAFEPASRPTNCTLINLFGRLVHQVTAASKPRLVPGQTLEVPPVTT